VLWYAAGTMLVIAGVAIALAVVQRRKGPEPRVGTPA
jgi:hypothetical protein